MPFPIIDVSQWPIETPEQMGAKAKDWRSDPQKHRWMWKLCRTDTRTGIYSGEDWSEKIAAEIAQLLGLPHAIVELATRETQRGVIVRSFLPSTSQWKMTHGNEALSRIIDNYPVDQIRGLSLHTVSNVFNFLSNPTLRVPTGVTLPKDVTTASDVFVGYLLLDALIGNGDRHHQNWAILEKQVPVGQEFYAELAPTYDHASSLGRELTDQGRDDGLSERKPSRSPTGYMERCKSALYRNPADANPISPFLAFQIAAQLRPTAATAWLAKLEECGLSVLEPIIDAIPAERMSALARQFAMEMLQFNRKQLLEGAQS